MTARATIVIPAQILFVGCSSDSGSDRAAAESAGMGAEMSTASGPPPVTGDTVTTDDGLKYIVISEGDGARPEAGNTVQVHYTGWFTDGRKFDSSIDRGQPIAFPLGQGAVIPGWDEAISLMRVGDRRRLVIPPDLAYGERGHPAGIPPNSTLIFDVELVGIGQ